MPDTLSPGAVNAIREAMEQHGWFVADVVTGKWIESRDWVPVVIAALIVHIDTLREPHDA